MPSDGVVNFYYSKTLPARSVAIAQVSVPVLTPAQLTDVNNTVYGAGVLEVWKSTTSLSSPPDFLAPDLNIPIEISGSLTYFVGSQFFELTNVLATDETTPLFYIHQLPAGGVTNVQVLDLDGTDVTSQVELVANMDTTINCIYHSLDGAPYRVQYANSADGSLIQQVLMYSRTMQQVFTGVSAGSYNIVGNLLTLPDIGTYWFRFTQRNGYQVLPMYTYLPNIPWYPRIRFGLLPPPGEWATQLFLPAAPWLLGTYVSGKVLDLHMIEFERPEMYNGSSNPPDILIFDQFGNIKYALGLPATKGYVYNWQAGQISSLDQTYARVDVAVELDPTDIIWGFYTYAERDVIYADFDLNPVTNSMAKNTVLVLYVEFPGGTPGKNIYHQLFDASGNVIAGQTNDPSPPTWTELVPSAGTVFAQVMIGASVSEVDFTFTDARVRGGGLALQYQGVPQAVNFWDIGYWDGKPYPIAGAVAIYLPYSILDVLSRADVEGRVSAALPMGAMPILRYIDSNGMEWV